MTVRSKGSRGLSVLSMASVVWALVSGSAMGNDTNVHGVDVPRKGA